MTQKDAITIMQMGNNVYLTGDAGTGKTYALQSYIKHLKKFHVPVAITASTGIAATHLEGVTIDSWSGLGIRDAVTEKDLQELAHKFHLKKRLTHAKILIIDEISMIDGRRFDAINQILKYVRKSDQPFGGLQVILSGDLFQLPPVSRDHEAIRFIFQSDAWKELDLRICYLHEARRQKDKELLAVLSDIRHGKVNESTRSILQKTKNTVFPDGFIPTKLFTHNVDVDAINQEELEKNKSESHLYFMTAIGSEKLIETMKRTCLAPEKLELKKNALVMFVRNNYEKGYVNGTLGKVIGFDHNNDPIVQTYEDKKITVIPENWTITEDNQKIVAQLTQHPLRLAWAITVHKSQGMTLSAAEVDLSKSFVEGMGYVALSRVKSLSGLRLLGINDMALRVNKTISEIDQTLVSLSDETTKNLKHMGFLRIFLKKRKFMYQLTSSKEIE